MLICWSPQTDCIGKIAPLSNSPMLTATKQARITPNAFTVDGNPFGIVDSAKKLGLEDAHFVTSSWGLHFLSPNASIQCRLLSLCCMKMTNPSPKCIPLM